MELSQVKKYANVTLNVMGETARQQCKTSNAEANVTDINHLTHIGAEMLNQQKIKVLDLICLLECLCFVLCVP